MTLNMHVCPRVLLVTDAFSGTTSLPDSIMAGCQRGNTLARIFLYPVLEDAHAAIPAPRHPSAINYVRQFVGDLAQVSAEESSPALVHNAGSVAVELVSCARRHRLKLPAKKNAIDLLECGGGQSCQS